MVDPGGAQQLSIEVHPGDVVAAGGQRPADPPGSAAGIKHACPAGEHRIEEPGLAVEILTGFAQLREAFDVVPGLPGIPARLLLPEGFVFHVMSIDAGGPGAAVGPEAGPGYGWQRGTDVWREPERETAVGPMRRDRVPGRRSPGQTR
ncbi:hypothetical protein GCM10025778_26190 [Paeniglutamicibacter antarcticus]|uniref:Uncharacterized protein n=1 Tax=Paeniglutamicibacter antarcticus TaxID=494023 RepID=A0ABP9TNX0_9MICC